VLLEALADPSTAGAVNNYGTLGLLGALAFEGIRFLGSIRRRWEEDREVAKAIATAQIRAMRDLARSALQIARTLQRPEDRDTVPLELPDDPSRPIDLELKRRDDRRDALFGH
jgi:hypothetical protein